MNFIYTKLPNFFYSLQNLLNLQNFQTSKISSENSWNINGEFLMISYGIFYSQLLGKDELQLKNSQSSKKKPFFIHAERYSSTSKIFFQEVHSA